jgi:hypothetical protein
MRTITPATFFLAAAMSFPSLAAEDCEALARAANIAAKPVPGSSFADGRVLYKVVGSNPLQFYSAPSESCKLPGGFILPGPENIYNPVIGLVTYGKFTKVEFQRRLITGNIEAWLLSSRLKATGDHLRIPMAI